MTTTFRKLIGKMTYKEMLRKQRFCPAGDPFFQMTDEEWSIWQEQYNRLREATGDNGVSASKELGWE